MIKRVEKKPNRRQENETIKLLNAIINSQVELTNLMKEANENLTFLRDAVKRQVGG